MTVIYNNELWQLPAVRGTLFEDYKKSNPNRLVYIFRDKESKQVKIKDLTDYSVYRNT